MGKASTNSLKVVELFFFSFFFFLLFYLTTKEAHRTILIFSGGKKPEHTGRCAESSSAWFKLRWVLERSIHRYLFACRAEKLVEFSIFYLPLVIVVVSLKFFDIDTLIPKIFEKRVEDKAISWDSEIASQNIVLFTLFSLKSVCCCCCRPLLPPHWLHTPPQQRSCCLCCTTLSLYTEYGTVALLFL